MSVTMDVPCKPWDGRTNKRGYGYLYVKGVRWYAHRWTFLQVNGFLPKVVRHRCDNPPCVEPTHLLAGTQADNLRDCFERGRARRAQGEQAPTAKLTCAEVVQIRAAIESGEQISPLARRYGVERKTIRQIRDGKSWKSCQ